MNCDKTCCDSQIQTSADQASDCTKKNNMQTNTDKMKEMCVYFGHKRLQIKSIMIDGINIERLLQKIVIDLTKPSHKLNHLFPIKRIQTRVRNAMPYEPPKIRTERFKNSPISYGLFNFQECL